ncbi:hypothetical protein M1N05_01270 [Dehalococcoidales bacterium]|nr:hypothetical protein [Dehalococcoidales bacterium]MCL0091595.1 hypothetical protein [Dehalococcoidales bacterium]
MKPLEKKVVTCFLESDGEILILRRSAQVSSYQGRWAGVSGYIETTADEADRDRRGNQPSQGRP